MLSANHYDNNNNELFSAGVLVIIGDIVQKSKQLNSYQID